MRCFMEYRQQQLILKLTHDILQNLFFILKIQFRENTAQLQTKNGFVFLLLGKIKSFFISKLYTNDNDSN